MHTASRLRMCSRADLGAFGLVFLAASVVAAAPPIQVEQWSVLPVVLRSREVPQNPFTEVDLHAVTKGPDGTTRTVTGFYDGNGEGGQNGVIWKLRFCPDLPGTWTWTTRSNLPELDGATGRFECVPSARPGPVIAAGRSFRHAAGDPVFLIGNFLDDAAPPRRRYSHTLFSERLSDLDRRAIVERAAGVHGANKINVYLANRGDYGGLSTTPWLGTAGRNDKTRFDLKRWHMFEDLVRGLDRRGMIAELWFFADDSNFGKLSTADRHRLIRYGMARLGAFPNTMFVLCLEWQEGWSREMVAADVKFGQAHNPWKRLWSVHGVNGNFAFPDQPWVDFKATQPGNDIRPVACNAHTRYNVEVGEGPLLVEELGHSSAANRVRVRANAWAAFCGGAAGVGTGADLDRLRTFIETRHVPFWRMVSDNSIASRGFARLEYGREIVVYVPAGVGPIRILLAPGVWRGVWFNPRDGASPGQVAVHETEGGGRRPFFPPGAGDWVLHLRNQTPARKATSDATPLVRNGWIVWNERAVLGWVQHNGWWRPGQRPNLARNSIGDPHGDVRPCRTEDLDQLTDSMLRYGYPGFEHNFGLWFDRRRDAHDTRRRSDPFVRPPFLEQPWARSGSGRAADGLSRYDLTRFNPWYFYRIKAFADLCDAKGTVLFYKFYMQHALLEQPCHYIDFPWKPGNCVQQTGMPAQIPAANAFYDVSNPVRRRLHRLYIRHCLDVLSGNRNVVFFPAEEYTGGLGFVQFIIDTVTEWEQENGRKVTLAVGATKDVLDRVLSDPTRSRAVDVLDLRYWWLRRDGSLFAPPGGKQVPGRDVENGFKAARETSPEEVYRKIGDFRRRFPDKAIVDALEADRGTTWAFFMAGGSRGQIHYPGKADPPRYIKPADMDIVLPTYTFLRTYLAEAWPRLHIAEVARAVPGPVWSRADDGRTVLVYTLHGGRVRLDLGAFPGAFRVRRFDPTSGKLTDAGVVKGGRELDLELPPNRDGVLWLTRSE
ncbi:MAG: DUF5060 domain-containing protein [Kiritimatiellaeota bacterium]|nr:DUF5060 domain-containing protein [Kiritimatiellota bacterium]